MLPSELTQTALNTVLIVDDDYEIRDVLSDVLESWGYGTLCASDGQVALNILKQTTPGLILLDLMMPGASGADFLATRSQSEFLMTIPVIMMSANFDQLQREYYSYDRVGKPFDLNRLQDLISRRIGRPSTAVASCVLPVGRLSHT